MPGAEFENNLSCTFQIAANSYLQTNTMFDNVSKNHVFLFQQARLQLSQIQKGMQAQENDKALHFKIGKIDLDS